MFTLDLEIAKEVFDKDSEFIIMFLVLVDPGRKLPVYVITDSSLVEVCSNIRCYRDFLIDVLFEEGFNYSSIVSISYVQ